MGEGFGQINELFPPTNDYALYITYKQIGRGSLIGSTQRFRPWDTPALLHDSELYQLMPSL